MPRCGYDDHELSGSVTISYTNNSPDNLPFLWLQLDQNIYRKDSRGEATAPVTGGRWSNKTFTDGDVLKSVAIIQNGQSTRADYVVTDTRMQIRLADALRSEGGSLQIKIDLFLCRARIRHRSHGPSAYSERMD